MGYSTAEAAGTGEHVFITTAALKRLIEIATRELSDELHVVNAELQLVKAELENVRQERDDVLRRRDAVQAIWEDAPQRD